MMKVLTIGICFLVSDRRFSGSKLKSEVSGSSETGGTCLKPFLETSMTIAVILKLPVALLPGGLHQEILSQLQNWNVAPRLPQRSASAAAGKRLQREGETFFLDVHVVVAFPTFLQQSMCKHDLWLRLLLQVDTLIMMYKTHCQCILDNAINVNFEEVSAITVAPQGPSRS